MADGIWLSYIKPWLCGDGFIVFNDLKVKLNIGNSLLQLGQGGLSSFKRSLPRTESASLAIETTNLIRHLWRSWKANQVDLNQLASHLSRFVLRQIRAHHWIWFPTSKSLTYLIKETPFIRITLIALYFHVLVHRRKHLQRIATLQMSNDYTGTFYVKA